jgi:hypothetical protein
LPSSSRSSTASYFLKFIVHHLSGNLFSGIRCTWCFQFSQYLTVPFKLSTASLFLIPYTCFSIYPSVILSIVFLTSV